MVCSETVPSKRVDTSRLKNLYCQVEKVKYFIHANLFSSAAAGLD